MNNGSNAGFVYSHSDYVPSNSNANVGSRQYFSTWTEEINYRYDGDSGLASRQKTSGPIKVQVVTSVVWTDESSITEKQSINMKRAGNLYGRIISMENLESAERKARKGKEHRKEIKEFDKDRERLMWELHDMLAEHRYRTSEYEKFKVFDTKERWISRLPYYPDRIVQQAILNVLEPLWEKILIADTYSCIKGRGIMGAYRKMVKTMKDRKGSMYCLKIDISKFYPSIDHDVMKQIIRRSIKCRATLDLLDEIIDSADGMPMGNSPSQYMSNLFLAYFDHWIKEVMKIKYYVRYADDMVFFAEDKESLHRLIAEIKEYLAGLRLKVKDNWQIFPVADSRYDKSGRGVDFLGFVFYHSQIQIRKRIKKNLCRKAARYADRKDITPEEYLKQMCSYFGWAQYSNSRHLMKKVLDNEKIRKAYRKHNKLFN